MYNVIFDQEQPMDVSFGQDSFDVSFGLGVPIRDYFGPYEVTPSEQALILPTRNKSLEDNLKVLAIPSEYIITQGTKFITANDTGIDVSAYALADVAVPWTYEGEEPELLDTYSYDYTLADTTFASWTPSTTAKTIKSGVTAGSFLADMDIYEYLLRWQTEFIAKYKSGATLKIIPYKQVVEAWQVIDKRANALQYITASNDNGNACITYFTAPICAYYNSSGSLVSAYTASYGIYPALTAATFSSGTSNTPTVTVKTPAITARCSTTYMATARASEIDTTSTFKTRGWLYRIKKGGFVKKAYENVISLYNNPLQ